MTKVVIGVISTFCELVVVMLIAGRIEYKFNCPVLVATSMNGGVIPVTGTLNEPSVAVVPVAVLAIGELLSLMVMVADASAEPVAAMPVIV